MVAAASALRVYELHSSKPEGARNGTGAQLVLAGEYQLYGNVQSLHKVQLSQTKRDTLLLSFKDAKLSLVEYDPENNDLRTVSLHCFEEDELSGGLVNNFHRPVVRVDPDGRCATMLVYGHHLAVLPFRHDVVFDEQEPTSPTTPSAGHTTKDFLPSYTVDLQSLTERVCNVKDIQFLHGYNSPTVFVLYEPIPTWAGRITLRRDTHCIVAISLNTSDHTSPVIWTVGNLPFDCCYALPVPRPIGGMVIVGANSLLYLNQSSPPYGVSLNSTAESTSNFPLRKQTALCITMDCSHAVFVSDEHFVATLRGGEIFVFTLVPEGMRGVRNILCEKVASSVITSCVCKLLDNFLFFGSRLGNSIVLSYTRKAHDFEDSLEASNKKRKVEQAIGEDLEDLEVYGMDAKTGPQLHTFKFEVCDSLLNIGPIANVTLGEPVFLSEEFTQGGIELELVACSGHGKNGALSVLQRGVRPQVVTTFELPGCTNMWTVFSKDDQDSSNSHSFLILRRQESTMVLRTGQEITELDALGFATQAPTVFVGNVGGGRFIVQVTCTDVRLLKGEQQMHFLPLDMGGGVKSCDITDPYGVILLVDGAIVLLELKEENGCASLAIEWPEVKKGSPIVVMSTYTDCSGLFTTEASDHQLTSAVVQPSPAVAKTSQSSVDEEDELLYGDIKQEKKEESSSVQQSSPHQQKTSHSKTHWCVICREDGSLEIYRIPDFQLVYCIRNFSTCRRTLIDSGPMSSSMPAAAPTSNEQSVQEVLIAGLGPEGTYPHLLALVDRELVVYKAFAHVQIQNPGHLHIRFSKATHKVLLSDRKSSKVPSPSSQPDGTDSKDEHIFVPRLRQFRDVGGLNGVFICGPYPHWLLMSHRAALHIHPMSIDGEVISFAPFHNVNCPNGFLYFNSEGELRICVLPSHLSYDSYWPVRKVPLKNTAHFVSYHMESKTHAVITSVATPVTMVPRLNGDEMEQMDTVERDEQFPYPSEKKFYLQLYSPQSWEVVPHTKFGLEHLDRVTSMKVLRLRSQETLSGRKEYIVVGATTVCGEDVTCRGKILIFDVTEVIPEPGKPLTKHKLKCLYNQEQKGPISALESVEGLLLSCMGQKIFMWHFKDNKDLVGVAFIDTEIYVHTAHALKNFILIGDVTRSVQLLRYQENLKTLSLISQDPLPANVYACGYVIDGHQLSFIVSDDQQNLMLLQYQPELPESCGGLYLIRRTDFNVCAHVNAFFHVQSRSSAPLGASREVKQMMTDKRHVTFLAALDGRIGLVLPIVEKMFRRLHMLQIRLAQGLPHTAGLNPKSYRMFRSSQPILYCPQRNMLDGELLWQYTQLSWKDKTDFAKQIGTTPTQILEDLKEIDKVTAHF